MKLDNERKQAAQKKSIEYPNHLKHVENNEKCKECTNLKPGTKVAYKSRQYGEKDGHKLMKTIIAQQKSYNNEQERKRQKKTKEMNAKKSLGGIEGSVGNEINNIDLVMASNTHVTQNHNNNIYGLCVDNNNI